MRQAVLVMGVAFAVVAVRAGAAAAADTAACQAGKNKAVGKYAGCRQKAEAKLALNGDAAAYARVLAHCDLKFAKKWMGQEQKSACATTMDEGRVRAFLERHSRRVAKVLSGLGILGDPPLKTGQSICFSDPNPDIFSGEPPLVIPCAAQPTTPSPNSGPSVSIQTTGMAPSLTTPPA